VMNHASSPVKGNFMCCTICFWSNNKKGSICINSLIKNLNKRLL
jgi:hypothetical protein